MQRLRATLMASTLLAGLSAASLAAAHDHEDKQATATATVQVDANDGKVTTSTNSGAAARPSRERVREMQRALAARNLYQGKIDGSWGRKTEAALRNFQTQQGLEVTGHLNGPTAEALGLQPEKASVANNPPRAVDRQPVSGRDTAVQKHSQPALEDGSTNVQLSSLSTEQVKEMQQRLQLLGHYRGPIDGQVGEATRGALQRYFRHQAELASKGVISNAAIGLFGTEPNEVRAVSGRD